MATERCIELLLESKDFGTLDTDDQANRLARFMSDWFDLDHKLDTVDHVRLTARLRTHASKMKISAGEVMEILLPVARRLHAQSVYEREAARIRDEDRRAEEIVEAKAEDTPLVREYQHPGAVDTQSTIRRPGTTQLATSTNLPRPSRYRNRFTCTGRGRNRRPGRSPPGERAK